MIDPAALVERKTTEAFPSVVIDNPNDNVPVVVRSLEKGDMQLIVQLGGKRRVVERISTSALNIDKLIRTVGSIVYQKSPTERIVISSVVEYLNSIIE